MRRRGGGRGGVLPPLRSRPQGYGHTVHQAPGRRLGRRQSIGRALRRLPDTRGRPHPDRGDGPDGGHPEPQRRLRLHRRKRRRPGDQHTGHRVQAHAHRRDGHRRDRWTHGEVLATRAGGLHRPEVHAGEQQRQRRVHRDSGGV